MESPWRCSVTCGEQKLGNVLKFTGQRGLGATSSSVLWLYHISPFCPLLLLQFPSRGGVWGEQGGRNEMNV